MGKKQPAPPAPPDPAAVARAQTGTNVETAIANAYIGNANEIGPQGSVTYEPTSWHSINGPQGANGVNGTGGPMPMGGALGPLGGFAGGSPSQMGGAYGTGGYSIPQFTRTVTLSPEQQKLYDQQTKLGGDLNQLAIDQTGRLKGVLDKPINLNNEATEGRLWELGRKRLDPLMQQRRAALETQLHNQGGQPGTEAWTRGLGDFGQQENDAYNELLLKGRAQSVQEALTERNQPINEISALMSGGQVSMPNFAGYNAPQMQSAPIGDYMYNTAALNQQNYATQQQQRAAQMGGLFGLGQAGILGAAKFAPMLMSDRRLKRDIRDLGIRMLNGLTLYAYKYLWEPFDRVGVMADEVALVRPQAVHRVGNYLAVDYGRL